MVLSAATKEIKYPQNITSVYFCFCGPWINFFQKFSKMGKQLLLPNQKQFVAVERRGVGQRGMQGSTMTTSLLSTVSSHQAGHLVPMGSFPCM